MRREIRQLRSLNLNQISHRLMTEIHEVRWLKYERFGSMNIIGRDVPSSSEFISITARNDGQCWSNSDVTHDCSRYRCNGATCACIQLDSSICCSPGNQRCSLLPGPTPTPPTLSSKVQSVPSPSTFPLPFRYSNY